MLDVERLTISYDDPASLYRDLTRTGGRNVVRQRQNTLTGKTRFRQFENAIQAQSEGAKIELSIELVYGHAWGGGPRQPPGEYRVDPERITRMRRNR